MAYIDYWHAWLIIAFIILTVELMTGTYFLLALAGGAFLTSLITWLSSASLSMQLLCFAIGSALSYWLLLSCKKKKPVITDGTNYMLGQEVEVIDSIEHRGRVRYKGVLWQAESTDKLQKGSYARIIEVNGSTLKVESRTNQTQGDET